MSEKIVCPKCHNPRCESDHDYCWNCGYELGNYCTNTECPQIGLSDVDEYVVQLPSDYAHCPYCGHPSRYALDGYIAPLEFDP